MAWMFHTMVVAGVGLLGGSLALAARRRGLVEKVIGYGRGEKNLRWAKSRGIIDGYFMTEDEFPAETDFLVLATPVQAIVPIAGSFLPRLAPSCLVSDVGSVKASVVRDMERLLPNRMDFVGAHPIAGNEQSGAQAARADLFLKRRCILTPTCNTGRAALRKIACFWRRVGAKVEFMDPRLHDEAFAVVSHLPHVVAYALVNTLADAKADPLELEEYCAGGFKDITRIASSPPEVWRDICVANRSAIGKSLGRYIKHLERMRRWIATGQGTLLEREFARANETRRHIP